MSGHAIPALLVSQVRAALHRWWETHAPLRYGLLLTQKPFSLPDIHGGNQNEHVRHITDIIH